MYLQLEVYYYSNEANKNRYKNIQLIASTKNNLKIAADCKGHCTRNDNLSYFIAWASLCCLGGVLLLESIFIQLQSILLLESKI